MSKFFNSKSLFLFASALCLLTFQFARVLTSISVGLLLISGIWALLESPSKLKTLKSNPLFLIMVLLFVLPVLDILKGPEIGPWSDELARKIGVIAIPLAVITHIEVNPKIMRTILAAFVITMAGSAGISSVKYLMDMDAINTALLQSKHVPLIADVHHIYFGLFLAISMVVTFWLFRTERASQKRWWMLLLIVQFVSMQLLSSRTGLIAFYAGVFVMAFVYFVQIKKLQVRIGIAVGLLLLPLVAVVISPSLRHKISNTQEDIAAADTGGENINFKSFAMRMEAWKMCLELIKEHPLVGVGASNLEKELANKYEESNSVLIEENRVGPHNQFLESTVAHGFVGGLSVLALFLIPLGYAKRLNIFFIGTWAILGTAMMVESLFERQLGIILFGFFFFWSFSLLGKKK